MLSSSPSRSFTDFCHQKGFLHLVTFFYGVIETKSFLCFILACTTVPNLQIKYLVLVIPMEYCGVIFFSRVGGGGIVFFFGGVGGGFQGGGGGMISLRGKCHPWTVNDKSLWCTQHCGLIQDKNIHQSVRSYLYFHWSRLWVACFRIAERGSSLAVEIPESWVYRRCQSSQLRSSCSANPHQMNQTRSTSTSWVIETPDQFMVMNCHNIGCLYERSICKWYQVNVISINSINSCGMLPINGFRTPDWNSAQDRKSPYVRNFFSVTSCFISSNLHQFQFTSVPIY